MAYQVATENGYGDASYSGPASDDPKARTTSALADALKAKNAEGDGCDHLQDMIEHGTARNNSVDLQSPQTRDLADKSEGNRDPSPVYPGMVRQQAPAKVGDVQVGELPKTAGANAAPAPVDPFA